MKPVLFIFWLMLTPQAMEPLPSFCPSPTKEINDPATMLLITGMMTAGGIAVGFLIGLFVSGVLKK